MKTNTSRAQRGIGDTIEAEHQNTIIAWNCKFGFMHNSANANIMCACMSHRNPIRCRYRVKNAFSSSADCTCRFAGYRQAWMAPATRRVLCQLNFARINLNRSVTGALGLFLQRVITADFRERGELNNRKCDFLSCRGVSV